MGLSWFTGLFNLFFWLFIFNIVGLIISSAVYICAVLLIAINAEFAVRKAQEKLTESSGEGIYVDSDKYWIIGMFYCNPNDKHTMINARFGLGMTVNLAKPIGKIIMAFGIVTILAMPVIGIALIPVEFTPVRLELGDDSIIAYQTSFVYEVRFDDIREIELLDSLPRGARIVGTAFDSLLKGRFRLDDIGMCFICLNPQVPPFILIVTDDTTYVFGTADSTSTRTIYNSLV